MEKLNLKKDEVICITSPDPNTQELTSRFGRVFSVGDAEIVYLYPCDDGFSRLKHLPVGGDFVIRQATPDESVAFIDTLSSN